MKKTMVKATSIALALSAVAFPVINAGAQELTVDNISGSDRFSTAVSISKNGWKNGSKSVILVNSEAVADSLSVAPLASKMKCPVLLTESETLNRETSDEIKRLDAKDILIVGGTNSVSSGIEKELKDSGYEVERVSGKSRIETSVNIAERLKGKIFGGPKQAFLVNGETGLADAAGVGAVAAKEGDPIIFVEKNGEDSTKNSLYMLGIDDVYLIGGKTSIPEGFEKIANSAERITGSDRNSTNLNIIKKFYNDFPVAYIADDGSTNPSKLIDSVLINAGIIASNAGGSGSDLPDGPVVLVSPVSGFTYDQMRLLNNPLSSISQLVQVSGGKELSDRIDTMSYFINNNANPEISQTFSKMLGYQDVKIQFKMKKGDKVLTGNKILPMMVCDKSTGYKLKFDRSKVKKYAASLDKSGNKSDDKNTYAYRQDGKVKIARGGATFYIDVNAETDDIMKMLGQCKSFSNVKPIYKKESLPEDITNLGKKYVEINLTTQNMKVWVNDKVVIDTPVVTGNPNTGMATPPGIFRLRSKSRNVVLRGPGYASPVQYWMPFNGGIGIHDAYWQPVYGGNRYLIAGSHGCINTPLKKVAQVYETIEVGTPVIVHR